MMRDFVRKKIHNMFLYVRVISWRNRALMYRRRLYVFSITFCGFVNRILSSVVSWFHARFWLFWLSSSCRHIHWDFFWHRWFFWLISNITFYIVVKNKTHYWAYNVTQRGYNVEHAVLPSRSFSQLYRNHSVNWKSKLVIRNTLKTFFYRNLVNRIWFLLVEIQIQNTIERIYRNSSGACSNIVIYARKQLSQGRINEIVENHEFRMQTNEIRWNRKFLNENSLFLSIKSTESFFHSK